MQEKQVIILSRVLERHPYLDDKEVLAAYHNAFLFGIRPNGDILMIGTGKANRELEIIATATEETVYIYHAMKLTKKFLKEIKRQNVDAGGND